VLECFKNGNDGLLFAHNDLRKDLDFLREIARINEYRRLLPIKKN